MSRWQRILLGAWSLLSGAIIIVIVGISADWGLATSVTFLLISMVATGYLIADSGSPEARQELAFLKRYGSLDGARATLDLDALRAVRDAQGNVHAIRLVRKNHRDIPLAQAVEIVRGL